MDEKGCLGETLANRGRMNRMKKYDPKKLAESAKKFESNQKRVTIVLLVIFFILPIFGILFGETRILSGLREKFRGDYALIIFAAILAFIGFYLLRGWYRDVQAIKKLRSELKKEYEIGEKQ